MLPSSFQKVVGAMLANFGDMWLDVVAVWLTDWWKMVLWRPSWVLGDLSNAMEIVRGVIYV